MKSDKSLQFESYFQAAKQLADMALSKCDWRNGVNFLQLLTYVIRT